MTAAPDVLMEMAINGNKTRKYTGSIIANSIL